MLFGRVGVDDLLTNSLHLPSWRIPEEQVFSGSTSSNFEKAQSMRGFSELSSCRCTEDWKSLDVDGVNDESKNRRVSYRSGASVGVKLGLY